MKKRILFTLMAVLTLSVGCFSCKTPGEDVTTEDYNYINGWIEENLDIYYYWRNKLPTGVDKTLSPYDFFDEMIYWYDPETARDGDRFSWIQDDYQELIGSLSGVVSGDIGFDFALYLKDDVSNDVVGVVTYVKKNTPAESQGVKRGMWFDKIGGTALTTANYQDLLNFSTEPVSISFLEEAYDNDGKFVNFLFAGSKTVQPVSNYAENPVYQDTVFTLQGGQKVGYFVYNFFAQDGLTNDAEYDRAMNAVFGRFKAAGITDLVLDLRYNSGGSGNSSMLLASMIVPNLSSSQLYVYYQYNGQLQSYYRQQYGENFNKTYFANQIIDGTNNYGNINNVGNQLNGKLYVLTGNYTASASEQVINGLKPFMQVYIIGDTTYGKNVASIPIYDEDNLDKNRWGMEPIVAKYFNSLGESEFTAGFAPNIRVQDATLGMRQLGDPQENLLGVALAQIAGVQAPASILKRSAAMGDRKALTRPNVKIRGLQLERK